METLIVVVKEDIDKIIKKGTGYQYYDTNNFISNVFQQIAYEIRSRKKVIPKRSHKEGGN